MPPMVGTGLQTLLAADILTQLEAQFPIASGLLPAEQTKLETAQTELADALAAAIGPDTVDYIQANALVTVEGVSSGPDAAEGTVE